MIESTVKPASQSEPRIANPQELNEAGANLPLSQNGSSGQGDKMPCIGIKRRREHLTKLSWNPQEKPTIDRSVKKIVIWDLDETLIIFNSLLSGTHQFVNTSAGGSPVGGDKQDDPRIFKRRGEEIGEAMMALIFKILDRHMFFEELQNRNHCEIGEIFKEDFVGDVQNYKFNSDNFLQHDRNSAKYRECLSHRYKVISDIYKRATAHNIAEFHPEAAEFTERINLLKSIDEYAGDWLKEAKQCLKILSERPDVEMVLVTNCHLVPALAKLLVYDLDTFFTTKDIYSSIDVGKVECFERIKKRFENADPVNISRIQNGKDPHGEKTQRERDSHTNGLPKMRENTVDLFRTNQALAEQTDDAKRRRNCTAPEKWGVETESSNFELSSQSVGRAEFIAVGDGPEEAAASAELGFHYVKTTCPSHFKKVLRLCGVSEGAAE